MKQKYSIKSPSGSTLYETDNLAEFTREAERLKYRRTGRTTRMLFDALGSSFPEVLIIAKNQVMSEFLIKEFIRILENMEFDYTFKGKIIKNFGKEYHFLTKDELNENDAHHRYYRKFVRFEDKF